MKQTIHISGMHCTSCEILLEQEIKKLSNITFVKVSYKKRLLEVEGENFSLKKIHQIILKNGYQISPKKDKKSSELFSKIEDLAEIIALIFLGILALSLLSRIELTRFFPEVTESVSIFVALLLGLVASVSTCLALTGGLVMSFSSQYATQKQSFFQKALPQIYFHLGRILSFFLLGGLLGLIGSNFQYSTTFTGYLTIFVALIMLYIGLQILKIVPNIARLGFYLPKVFSNQIHTLKEKKHPLIPGIIGALTFFLPCGFTQSMQLVAVSSGSFWTGGLIMAFFAIGTLPVLFSIGIGSSYSQNKQYTFFKKIVAIIILLFGLYSLNSGFNLIGSTISFDIWNNQNSVQSIETSTQNQNSQTVTMNINYIFEPSVFSVKKGIPVKFVINANQVSGCTNEVIIPSLNLKTGRLQNGQSTVLEFTPQKTGTIPFSCWMGMVGGKFIVE